MKLNTIGCTNRLVLLLLFGSLLSSCFSYRDLNKREPIDRDFLLSLEPGKRYKFELWSGKTEYIDVTNVEAETVNGLIHVRGAKRNSNKSIYSSSFKDIEKDVAKISGWKVNPYTTTLTGILGAYATLYVIAILTLGFPE